MRTYAITSGKGGVGKTNVSANLAIALADRNQRVVIFDADIGLANLDVVLGCRAEYCLQAALSGERTIQEILQRGPGGVQFIAGGSGIESIVTLTGAHGERFLAQLAQLETSTDILLFDTGAGIDENVMTLLSASDEIILVVTPDPSSITDAYATAKAIVSRRPSATIKVLMNMVDDEHQARAVYARLSSIAQQFLGRPLLYLGCVRYDARVATHIRQRRPFLLAEPTLAASQDVMKIAAALLGDVYIPARTSLTDRLRTVFGFGMTAAR